MIHKDFLYHLRPTFLGEFATGRIARFLWRMAALQRLEME
jgi:hypothetical protein